MSSIGEATKTMIRCFCSLFCRCLRANYTRYYQNVTAGRNYLSDLYSGCEVWGSRNFDTVHCCKNFSQVFCHCDFHLGPIVNMGPFFGVDYIVPARVMMPAVLSGLDCVLAVKIMLTASDCAPNRVGVKSPFLVCSELSTLLSTRVVERSIHYHRRFEAHL